MDRERTWLGKRGKLTKSMDRKEKEEREQKIGAQKSRQ